jgi:cobalt-zinc-cadmium efflux system outer membrane protein
MEAAMSKPSLMALVLMGTCLTIAPAHAAERLRLDQAVARALESNPTLAAEAATLRATQSRAQLQALPPAYTVGAEVENFAGTGATSGVKSAEATLRLGVVLELGGKREARQALGRAEVSQQQNRAEITRLDLASNTALRFVEVIAAQERLAFTRQRVTLAQRTRAEVAKWVAAARNPDSDLNTAEIAVTEAELEHQRAQQRLSSARLTLASTWGSSQADYAEAQADFTALPAIAPFEELAEKLSQTPEQRATAFEVDTLTARRNVVQAGGRPDVNFSVGVRRLQGTSDQALVMAVNVPLGSQTRAAYSVADIDAQIDAVNARREALRHERYQELFAKYQELTQARLEVESLRTSMIPKAEKSLAITRRGFDEGRFSFFIFVQAQKALFELQARTVDAIARYHTTLVEIERLTATTQGVKP